jgi:tetratricopeptide (TPR) repeat protein
MAAKAEAFRVCPKCGTRNKGKWEFCVRCGESLQDVTVASSSPSTPAKAKIQVGPASEASPVGALALAVLFVGALAGGIWWWRAAPTPTPLQAAVVVGVPRPSPPKGSSETLPDLGDEDANLARVKLAQNDPAGALPLLERAIAKNPNSAALHALYARVLVFTGNVQKAVAEYTTATQLDPQDVSFRTGKAGALNLAGRYDEALQEYQTLVARGGSPDVEEDLGQLLLSRKHDPAGALVHLRKASEGAPDDAAFGEQLASALEQTQDLAGAQKAYESVLKSNPGASASRGRLAEILFNEGKTDDAIALVRSGIALDSSVPLLHRDLGAFLERAGKAQEASAAYREYAKLAPNAPDAEAIKARADALSGEGGASP